MVSNCGKSFLANARNTVLALWLGTGAVVYPSLAGNGNLAILYKQFLTNRATEDLILFDREIMKPKRDDGEREVRLPNGTVITLRSWQKDHMAFASDGDHWLIALSRSRSITDESDLTKVEELMGYDGTNYWLLRLNNPVRLQLGLDDISKNLPQSLAFNTLTVIPQAEAVRNRRQNQLNVQLEALLALYRECISIIQFGCNANLGETPRIEGSRLHLVLQGKGKRIAQITGRPQYPESIAYHQDEKGIVVKAMLDYATDTLIIQRSYASNLLFEAKYTINSIIPARNKRPKEFYSWTRYKDKAGSIIAVAITNGVTMQLKIEEDNALIPDRVIGPASVSSTIPNNRTSSNYMTYLICAFFVLLALPWVRQFCHLHKQRNKKNDQKL